MVCLVQEISPPPSPHLVSNHILCDLSGFSHRLTVRWWQCQWPGPSRSIELLVWSHSERVILCERSKCINSQCWGHRIELLFVFWFLTPVIQQLFSPSNSVLCHSSRKGTAGLGTYQLLYVCFILSQQRAPNRHARRLKSCFTWQIDQITALITVLRFPYCSPNSVLYFWTLELFWARAVGLPSSVSCWLCLPVMVPGSTLGLWWGQNGDSPSLGETPRDQIVAQRTWESGSAAKTDLAGWLLLFCRAKQLPTYK